MNKPIVTMDMVNAITPEHDRTSCSDESPGNGGYRIKEKFHNGIVVEREFEWQPACSRCFLIEHVGKSISDEIEISLHFQTKLPEHELIIEKKVVKRK